VRGLRTEFQTPCGVIPAVKGVSFTLGRGETLGIVGESGCGKSVTALSIMRLVVPPGHIASGEVLFEGQDLLTKSEKAMQKIRGNRIAMIFQEPMTSLNPVHTIGRQVSEVIRLHRGVPRAQVHALTLEMLRKVGIPAPEQRWNHYPFQMSGGMRQRVMIAMALSCNPEVLIADEPTTALDVTIQAQILDLMRCLKEDLGMGVIMISHDLGVIAEMSQRVLVMYAGRVVEEAPVGPVFLDPLHPYTMGLLKSMPRLDTRRRRLSVIQGGVPEMASLPPGCHFHPRCEEALEQCREEEPPLTEVNGRKVACWLRTGGAPIVQ
jgi:oligopeptide/dipeptide ABC transporter ATP-binding protein